MISIMETVIDWQTEKSIRNIDDESKGGMIMYNIKVGDTVILEGKVTRITKEDEQCFVRSRLNGNWYFMTDLKHKICDVTDEEVKNYIGTLKDMLYHIESGTRYNEYNPELAALRYAIDVLEKEMKD